MQELGKNRHGRTPGRGDNTTKHTTEKPRCDAGEQSCKESNGEMRREWPIGARSWRTVNAKSSSLGISVIGN